MKNKKTSVRYHANCVHDLIGYILKDMRRDKASHRKINVNSTYLNAIVAHVKDIIESGNASSYKGDYPALYCWQ